METVWAIAEEYKPETFSDWLDVHQYATKHWEQDRLQRCSSVLVENGLAFALRDLLRPFFNSHVVNGIPEKIARNYYSNHEADRAEAEKQVKEMRYHRRKNYGRGPSNGGEKLWFCLTGWTTIAPAQNAISGGNWMVVWAVDGIRPNRSRTGKAEV